VISIVAVASLNIIGIGIRLLEPTDTQWQLIETLLRSYTNLGYTTAIICIFMLIYIPSKEARWIKWLATYGRMSLTNYVSQAVLGVIVFFDFGFGLYRYLGSTWSLIYGALFFAVQVLISKLWAKHFYYGPLEWIWRALTFFNFNIRMKREANT